MKIFCGDKELFEVSDSDWKILEHDLIDVQEDIERRLEWVIKHKVEQCYKRFKEEWDVKLASDSQVSSVPTKREDYVAFVLTRPDYKNRADREEL